MKRKRREKDQSRLHLTSYPDLLLYYNGSYQKFNVLQKVHTRFRAHTSCCSVGTGVERPGAQLTAHLHPAPRLRISGAVPPLIVYLFMVWKVKNLPFTIKIQHSIIIIYIYKHICRTCWNYRIIFKGKSHKYASCHRLGVMHVWKPRRIFVAVLNQYVKIFHNELYNLKYCIINITIDEDFQ